MGKLWSPGLTLQITENLSARGECAVINGYFYEFPCVSENFINDQIDEFMPNITFNCGGPNQYISGLYSDFDETHHDRYWRVECCSSPGMRPVYLAIHQY